MSQPVRGSTVGLRGDAHGAHPPRAINRRRRSPRANAARTPTMECTTLIADDEAVSPVIGIILVVAITVILAAVIGSFALGFGGQVENTAPQARFDFDYEDGGASGFNGNADDTVTITHRGGDTIDRARISVSGDGADPLTQTSPFPTTIETTSSATYENVNSRETIRIIWTNPDKQSSQTIAQDTAPP